VRVAQMAEEAIRHVHRLVVERLEQADREAAKKKDKGRARFRRLLETVREMGRPSTSLAAWSRVRELIRDNPSFDAIEAEAEREAEWAAYCAELRHGSSSGGGGGGGGSGGGNCGGGTSEDKADEKSPGGKRRRRRRRKKRSASSSDDDESSSESESGGRRKRRRKRRSDSSDESESSDSGERRKKRKKHR